MNILESLVAAAKKKRDQLEQSIANHITGANHSAPVAAQVQVSPIAQQRIAARTGQPAPVTHSTIAIGSPSPAPFNVMQATRDAIKQAPIRTAQATGLAAARVGASVGQGASGFTDLVTPGNGTSRVTKALNRYAQNIDTTAAHAAPGVNIGYHVMQAPLTAATFFTPGAVTKAAGAITKGNEALSGVTKATQLVGRGDKAVDKLKFSNDIVGRLAKQAVHGVVKPTAALNIAAGTAQDLGTQSGHGQDISPRGAAESIASNVGMSAGLPMLGELGATGARAVTPAIKDTIKATKTAVKDAQLRENADQSIKLQLAQNRNQRREIQKQLNQANKAGLPTDHPTVRNIHNAMQQNLENEYTIRNRVAERSMGRKVADKVLTAQPGMSMKSVTGHEDLTPEQHNFIGQYAEMIKNMGQGNGVDTVPTSDGGYMRVTNNVRGNDIKGKRMTNGDWFDRARNEIESGKGAYGASDEYSSLPTQKQATQPIPSTPEQVVAQKVSELQDLENQRAAAISNVPQPTDMPDVAPEKVNFNGREHTVVGATQIGNDTKYQLRDASGKEIWTNQAGYESAKAPATPAAKQVQQSPQDEINAIQKRANSSRNGKLTISEEKRIAELQGKTVAPQPDPNEYNLTETSTNKEISHALRSGELHNKHVVITTSQAGKPKQVHGTVVSSVGGKVRRVEGSMFASADNPSGEHYVTSGTTKIRDGNGTIHELNNSDITSVKSAGKPLSDMQQMMQDFKNSKSAFVSDKSKAKSADAAKPATTPEPTKASDSSSDKSVSKDELHAQKRPIAAAKDSPSSQGDYARALGLPEGWSAGVGGIGDKHPVDVPIKATKFINQANHITVTGDTEAELAKNVKAAEAEHFSGTAKPKPKAKPEPTPEQTDTNSNLVKEFDKHYSPSPTVSKDEKYAADWIRKNPEKALQKYDERVKSEFGVKHANIVGGDEAKFIIPKFDGTMSAAYHEPGSALAKIKYNQLLDNPHTVDKPVLIMAGGTGAGKTSALKDVLSKSGKSLEDYAAVVDTNSNRIGSVESRIKQAIDSGRQVDIHYVYRDPHEAFVNGVIPRAKKIGRIAPIAAHLDTHLGSKEVVQELHSKYADHPDVNVHVIDNTRGKGNHSITSIDNLPKTSYTKGSLQKKLEKVVHDEYKQGNITKQQRDTYFGTQNDGPTSSRAPRSSEKALSSNERRTPERPQSSRQVSPTEQKLAKYAPSEKELPEYGTKRVSMLDKAFRSTRSVIERQGEHGKTLANELQKARDTEEIYQAELSKQLPTVRSLKGKDFENFVEATQGRAKPNSPQIEKAIEEWQAVHPTIRDRAVKAGLDVGDLGPTYYPHFIDYDKIFKDKNTYNAAINHLVETGQAPNSEEAIKLLGHARDISRNRKFGNLEASREIDLPMYDKTPDSLRSYIQSSAHRIAQTEHFGAKDEKALKLIKDAGVQGYDTEAMKEAYDVAVGAKRYGQTATKFSNKARGFQSTTRLGLGALTNATQNVNTGIVTGHLRTLGAMAKQFNPKTREFVGDTGVISDAVLRDLKTQAGFTGKVLGKITAPGFAKVESFNRAVAATAGRDYALRLAQKGDEKTLRKLGVTGDINGNTLTESQQIEAARKVVEKTQFKVDPQDLPGWTDSPSGKLVAQFRTFSYSQSKFFSNEILKPMRSGNFMPAGRLLAALPVGYAMYELKRGINGRPEEENKTKRGLAAFQNVGGAGLVFDIYQSLNPTNSQYLPADRRVSMGLSTVGGPTAGLVAQGVGAVNDLIQRKNTPSDGSRLGGKLVVGNNGNTYTDATQAGRFALNQIPVVGGPLRNRLLPYKAQSQADQGGSGGSSSVASSSPKNQTAQIKAAFTTKDGKAFMKLSDADKKAAAASDPNMRALYTEYQAMKAATKTPDLYPAGLKPEAQQTLEKYARMTDQGRQKLFQNNPTAEYKYKEAQYEEDKAAGNLTQVQDIKRQKEVAKAKVGASFDKDIRDVYGMSKSDIYDLISTDSDGNSIAAKLIKYGDAMESAGLGDNKLRNSKGAVAIRPKEKGSGGGSGSSSKRISLAKSFKTPYDDILKSAKAGASIARSAKLAKS